jgi:hypothetical protein
VIVAAIGALGAWALASPVGSDPDGQFHLSSIWCGSGYMPTKCEPPLLGSENLDPKAVRVPTGVALAGTCNSYKPDYSASCETMLLDNRELTQTQFNNEGRLYPNLYYFAASKFVGNDIARSALTIRLFNLLLFVFLVTSLYLIAPKDIRDGVAVTLSVFMVPLGLFIVASNNGSSWTVIGVSVYWAFFVTFITAQEKVKWIPAGLLSLVSGLMALGSRVDGAMYIVLSTVVAILIAFARNRVSLRKYWYRTFPGLLLCLASGISYFSSGQSGALTGGLLRDENFGRTPVSTLFNNLSRLPALYMGTLGTRGASGELGWLDTAMPEMVSGLALFTAGGVILYSRKRRSSSEFMAVLTCFAALIIAPLAMLQLDGAFVGELVQARYVLPILLLAAGVFASGQRVGSEQFMSASTRILFPTLMTIAYSAALHTTIRRYVTGNDVIDWNLNRNREWWWQAGPPPMTIWFLGSACFAFVSVFLFHNVEKAAVTTRPTATEV